MGKRQRQEGAAPTPTPTAVKDANPQKNKPKQKGGVSYSGRRAGSAPCPQPRGHGRGAKAVAPTRGQPASHAGTLTLKGSGLWLPARPPGQRPPPQHRATGPTPRGELRLEGGPGCQRHQLCGRRDRSTEEPPAQQGQRPGRPENLLSGPDGSPPCSALGPGAPPAGRSHGWPFAPHAGLVLPGSPPPPTGAGSLVIGYVCHPRPL